MNLRNHKLGDIFLDTNGYLWYLDRRINRTVKSDSFALRLIPTVDTICMNRSALFKLPFPETVKKETNARRWGWTLTFDKLGHPFHITNHPNYLTTHLTKEEYPEYFL